jgi:hypothetical protein
VGDRINHLVQKPNAGKLHVRFDERDLETEPPGHRARSRLYHFLTKPMPQNRAIPSAFAAFSAVEVWVRHEENASAMP